MLAIIVKDFDKVTEVFYLVLKGGKRHGESYEHLSFAAAATQAKRFGYQRLYVMEKVNKFCA